MDREDLANIGELMDIEEDLASIVPVVGIVDTEGLPGWVDTEIAVETEDHPSLPPVDATYSTPDKWAIQQRQGCRA